VYLYSNEKLVTVVQDDEIDSLGDHLYNSYLDGNVTELNLTLKNEADF